MNKRLGFLFLLIICLLLLLIYKWANLSPTIKPDNIELSGILKNTKLITNPFYKDSEYALDIELYNKANMPLSDLTKPLYYNKYFHNIYIYVDGHVLKGNAELIMGQGFNTGTKHGYTYKPAVSKLNELGIPIKENQWLSDVEGFTYLGSTYPARIRYYVTNRIVDYELFNNNDNIFTEPPGKYTIVSNKKPELAKSFLIYSHYEKKWGKNLSWIKVVSIKEI